MGSNLISYPVSVGATEPSSPYSSFSYEPATMLNRCVMVKFDFLTAEDALPIDSSKDEQARDPKMRPTGAQRTRFPVIALVM